MGRTLLFLILSVITFGCNTSSNQSIDININEDGIFVNSTKVNLPSSLNEIKTIFGEPTNEIIPSQTKIAEAKKKYGAVPNNIYKYDNYGILIYQPADQEEVNSISIYFERPIDNLKLLNAFTGKLQLYGVEVNRNTSFNDLKAIPEIELSESNFRVCPTSSSEYELTFEFQNSQSKNRLNGFSIEKKKSSEKTNEKGWTEGDIEIFKAAISGLEEIKMLCSQYEVNISDFADCYTSRVVTAITIYEMQNPTSKTQAIFAEIMQDCIQQGTKR